MASFSWNKKSCLILFVAALFLLLFFHFQNLFVPAFWDDEKFIFQYPLIRDRGNPLLFWVRGQPETKAWALGFSINWLLYGIFGTKVFLYRLLALLIHWGNGLLVFRIVVRKNKFAAIFAAFVIWFHPLNVEPVAWIHQITTLLCGLLFLLWLEAILYSPKPLPLKTGLYLLSSVATKGFTYFLVLIELLKRKNDLGTKKYLFLAAALMLSLYFGLLTAVGVYSYSAEVSYGKVFYANLFQKITVNEKMVTKDITQIEKNQKSIADDSLKRGFTYLQNLVIPNDDITHLSFSQFWYYKLELMGKSSFFYLWKFVFPWENKNSYQEIYSSSAWFFFYLGISLFPLLLFLLLKQKWAFACAILTYLPVSGLFYVPYMKFSLVADRYAYIPLLALTIAIALSEFGWEKKKNRFIFGLWVSFLILRTGIYAHDFATITIPFVPY